MYLLASATPSALVHVSLGSSWVCIRKVCTWIFDDMYLPASASPSAFADALLASLRSPMHSLYACSCSLGQETNSARLARGPWQPLPWTTLHLCSRELDPWLERTARSKDRAATAAAQTGV